MCFRNKVGFMSEAMTKCVRAYASAPMKKETEKYTISVAVCG